MQKLLLQIWVAFHVRLDEVQFILKQQRDADLGGRIGRGLGDPSCLKGQHALWLLLCVWTEGNSFLLVNMT